jgi:hypothetical protein
MWPQPVAQPEPVLTPFASRKSGWQITLDNAASAQTPVLHQFIRQRYADTYQAHINHFLPLLLASFTTSGVQGVLGLQPGISGQFFVEQYADIPIEQQISKATGRAVDRRQVIETGNLASMKGGSQRLFIVLTELLYQAGFHWVCFTATPQVQALLHRLGFAPELLGPADPTRLPDCGQQWGSYYQHQPNVLAGDVRRARETLIKNEIAMRLLQEHADELALAVSVLTSAGAHTASARMR